MALSWFGADGWLTSPRLRRGRIASAMRSVVRCHPGEGDYPRVRVRGESPSRVYAVVGGFSAWRCDSVKISTPLPVTPTECSNCADSERSRVTAVQPSDRILTCGLPRLIIGSLVKKMPGFKGTPSPGRPTW